MNLLEALLWMALGAAIAIFGVWLRDKFIIIEYKIEQLHGGDKRTSKTDVQGLDGDIENEDVRGSIGFHG